MKVCWPGSNVGSLKEEDLITHPQHRLEFISCLSPQMYLEDVLLFVYSINRSNTNVDAVISVDEKLELFWF